jgi:hypothetical protein
MIAWLVLASFSMALAQTDNEIQSLSLGIESNVRLGKWTPILIEAKGLEPSPSGYIVTALDSSATTVEYAGTLDQVDEGTYQAIAKIGRQHGNLTVSLLDTDGQEIANQKVAVTSAGEILPSTTNNLLLIGCSQKVKSGCESAMTALLGEKPHRVIDSQNPNSLPYQWTGYDGINTVMISIGNMEQLKQVTAQQWQALERWVNLGGRLIVSANGAKGSLSEGGILSRFLVGTFNETSRLETLSRLDSFAKSRLQVDGLDVANLTVADGNIDLASKSLPLIVRQIKGLGQIVFVAFDISDPKLDEWDGIAPTVTRLLKFGELEEITADRAAQRSAGVGFTDLAGQLKIPLEKFSNVHLVNFTVVAVLIGLYILCVGPGDFFMLKKFAKKMELTWISFTLFTLAFCGLAYLLANWSRPQEMQINQLEIIDIDASNNTIRGNTWSNVFSPETGQHSIGFDYGDPEAIEGQEHLTSWLGSPGDGIGGMQSKAGLSVSQSRYRSNMSSDENGRITTAIDNFPLQVSSTRALHTEWSGKFKKEVVSKLKFENSTLTGQIVNPFPFELKNVRVIYRNYASVLNNTLPAEGIADLVGESTEWTVTNHLKRRRKTADKTDRGQNMPWDPTSDRMDRIADMMMFYAVAGGADYTSLSHDFHNRIEMSDHLILDRAILVGEVETKTSQILIDGQPANESYDQQLTVFRILLPVE